MSEGATWTVGQRVRHGRERTVYLLVRVVEDEWLGEPLLLLTLRDDTGMEKMVQAANCAPALAEDEPTEEVNA